MTKRMQEVLNINHPEYRGRVEADKYDVVKSAMAKILPREDGLTQSEMMAALKAHFTALSVEGNLFPNGDKIGWWAKAVQLDLEARGEMKRILGKPLRWVFCA